MDPAYFNFNFQGFVFNNATNPNNDVDIEQLMHGTHNLSSSLNTCKKSLNQEDLNSSLTETLVFSHDRHS
jgi:hypothetical protein